MGVFDPGRPMLAAGTIVLAVLALVQAVAEPGLAVPGLEISPDAFEHGAINLNLQDAMRTLRRMKRMATKPEPDLLGVDDRLLRNQSRWDGAGEEERQFMVYCLRMVGRGGPSNKYTFRSARPSRCEPGRQGRPPGHHHHHPPSSQVSSSEAPTDDAGRRSRAQDLLDNLLRLDPSRRQSAATPRNGRNETGKCVISADQAVHYCGFTEEVTAPIIPPPQQGKCHVSEKSGREVCYPNYEQLDTTCTDSSPGDEHAPGPVPPPVVKHATVRAMAFVAPDDLQRLIKQYYRQNQQPIPKDINYDLKPYLFARYKCDYGYELIDEVDTVFCSGRKWVNSMPECRGKGPCADDNGGCSHSCISPDNESIECRCPKGLVLDADDKTCIKPAPKNECKNLQGCTCESINDLQLSCTCRPTGEKCLLQKGPPKIYLHPAPPYQVEPGGSVNITCSGVGYPFPETTWAANSDQPFGQQKDPITESNSLLSVADVVKNGQFTCTSTNKHGDATKSVDVVVAGPDAARIDKVDPGRTSVDVHWAPPDHVNRPITYYTIYYTNNPTLPVKNWKSVDVNEPNRNFVIEDLRPDTEYTFRVRANDNLGPGKLSNAVTAKTQEAAKRPAVEIAEGEELRIAPNETFTLHCNVTRGDPTPTVVWESKGRQISNPQEGRSIALQHKGLLEETSFLCVAENEAGKTSRRIHVIVTGPTQPERVRTHVSGDDVDLSWEAPRITNGPIEDYEILYTDDPSLPEDQWQSTTSGGQTSLTIPDLKELTDYTFRIKGKNANGKGLPTKDYNVTTWLKPRPPEITLHPESDITAKPSTDELTIECEVIGVPKPKVAWFWNDNLVSDGEDGFRVYDISRMDTLNITHSKLVSQSTTRSGKVRCEAVNKEGSVEKEIDVKVQGPGSPPKDVKTQPEENGFKVEWKPPDIPNGDITQYVVYYSKDPDAPISDWQQVVVPADKLDTVIGDREEDTPYVVRLQAVTDDGPGIISEPYEVTTSQKHIPLVVRLEILDPASQEGVETEVEPGQKIRFRCVAEGRPTPTVSYNWLPLNNSESGEEPVHIRTSPKPGAEHAYVSDETESQTFTRRQLLCQARNRDGSVEDRHTFNVKKPGSPPLSITPDVDVDNKVTIKWDPPVFPNGDLTGYKVYLSADPSKPLDQWQKFDVTNPDEPQIEFNRGELEPDTPYHVRVVAINDDGDGIQSDPIPFQTQSGSPIDAPTDVVASVAQDNTVNLSWAGPSEPNGPIQAYTVYFAPEDEQVDDDNYKTWQKITIPSTDNLGNITLDKDEYQIKPNTKYRVRISATNDQSEGPASEPISFETGTGEIPPQIALSPADNPAKVDPKQDYTVTCSATGIPEPRVYWVVNGVKTDSNVLQLSALVKDTVVECHAINNAGQATTPLRIEVQGPGTPAVISSVSALPDQELQVEWSPPDEPNGQITEYKVKYGEIPEGETQPTSWEEITVPVDQVQTVIKGLKPKTVYAVKVQAVSDRGPGVESDSSRAKTLPLTPPPPQAAKVGVHDNNTVSLEFDAVPDPSDPTKMIKNYKIHYTSDDPLTEGTEWKEMTWTHPDDNPTVSIPIDGDNFKPHTKYNIKITPEGEITGTASDPMPFETGSGIIPPEKPTFNVDAPDNVIKVPAGTDYSVTCTSEGRPTPTIKWVDSEGNVVSDGPVLSVKDVKTTQNVKCVAENEGGKEEQDFQIYVAGPGDAPEITNIHAHKPRTIEVRWDPPKIPNGEITRYIVYYTPLDDQDPARQVGQVPSKPIGEWLTHHVVGENLNDGEKEATITDFINPDTSYAFVVQAVNDDGPGPYSVQQNIRTMSKAQEGPPTDLRVEPLDQRSAEIDWKPPENVEEDPIGYELYYVPANKEIEIDEFDSLPKWTKIVIDSGDATSHVMRNELEPNTEYVFKIRAIYPKGPGVFSEPCITKTLPEGNPPVIQVSSGGEGTEGTTKIDVLPGSSLVVFCNATGNPSPSVNWIRQGSTPIDPSTVKNEGQATRWSLNVENITEDATFNCVAQNPLGHANWTIDLHIVENLDPNWKNELLKAKQEGDDVVLSVDDSVAKTLKDPTDWKIKITDDPKKPEDEWKTIESNGRPLDDLKLDDTSPGKTYFVTVTDPNTGLDSPVMSFVTPKPAQITSVGTNLDDDIVVDFSPAIGPDDIEDAEGKNKPECYCPEGFELAEDGKTCNKIAGTETEQIVVEVTPPYEDRQRDQQLDELGRQQGIDGSPLPTNEYGKPVIVEEEGYSEKPLPTDSLGRIIRPIVRIDGSRLPQDGDGNYVNQLGDVVEYNEGGQPLDPDGNVLSKNLNGDWVYPEIDHDGHPLPLDKHGKHVYPIIGPDGNMLKTNDDGQRVDKAGEPIPTNPYGRPIGPDGSPLPTDAEKNYRWYDTGEDITDEPLPTDSMGHIVYPIVDGSGKLLPKNEDGHHVDESGVEVPTNEYGFPVHPQTAEQLPKNEKGQYVLGGKEETQAPETGEQQKGDEVGPTEQLAPVYDLKGDVLPTNEAGQHVDKDGNPIGRDSLGRPVDDKGRVLPTSDAGNYVFPEDRPTDASGKIQSVVGPDGAPLPTNADGHYVNKDGETIQVKDDKYVDTDGNPLPTDSAGNAVLEEGPQATELPMVDAQGHPLPKDEHGRFVDERGEPFRKDDDGRPLDKDGNLLPTDSSGNYVSGAEPKPTRSDGAPVSVVLPDGSLAETDSSGRPLDAAGNPLLIRDGQFVDKDGEPLPTDPTGNALLLPTDSSGNKVYPVHDSDGKLLPTSSDGHFVGPDGEPIQTDSEGKPIGPDGNVLPTDASGKFVSEIVQPTKADGEPAAVLKPDGSLAPTDSSGRPLAEDGTPLKVKDGQFVDKDGKPLPTDSSGNALLLPTDASGTPVYPVHDADGSLLPTDSEGHHVGADGQPIQTDSEGKPIGPDGSVLPTDATGKFVHEGVKPTKADGEPVGVVNPSGELVPTDSSGRPLDSDGSPLKVKDGHFVDKDGTPLPTDSSGNAILLPTDSSGNKVYPVYGPDGELLPTDSEGHHTGPDGKPVPTDAEGKPVGPDGNVLPTDGSGRFVQKPVKPTDPSGREVTPVGPDGLPLGKDPEGNYVKTNGSPVPTNADNQYVDSEGSPLPVDPYGRVVVRPDKPPKPTSASGQPIVVVGEDGRPLPTDDNGLYLDPEGNPIPTSSDHQYAAPDGSPLPVDPQGRVLIAQGVEDSTEAVLPTDEYGNIVYPIVDEDGQLLPTDSTGRHVDANGEQIPLNDFGKPLDKDGSPLPQNDEGQYVKKAEQPPKPTLAGGVEQPVILPDGQPAATDSSGRVLGPDGQPVEVKDGKYVDKDGHPLPTDTSLNVVLAPTDDTGLPVYPVVDADGKPLPTDSSGKVVGPDGQPIPVNQEGKPVGPDGNVLPKSPEGKFILEDKALASTTPGYVILGPDNQPLGTDSTGHFVDDDGVPVQIDSAGRPVDKEGDPLPKNADGSYILSGPEKAPKPTDASGKQVVVVDADGVPVPTDSSGNYVDSQGRPIPTDANQQYVGPDSSPLPTDQYGNVVLGPETGVSGKPLPTDQYGKVVYPIVDEDGTPLPKDATGRHVNSKGEPVPVDDFGRPTKPDGSPLPKNDRGEYVISEKPTPTDSSGKPIVVVDKDGQPLTKNSDGDYIGPDGQPVPTNAANEYVGVDGSPLPTTSDGAVVFGAEQYPEGKTLPTDETGREVHPVVDQDGSLLPTDSTGRHVDKHGDPIPIDEFGRPTDADGHLLPRNEKGHFVLVDEATTTATYGDSTIQSSSRAPVVIGPDGHVLPTDASGHAVGPDGNPLQVNEDNQVVDAQGIPLPTDAAGRQVLTSDDVLGTPSATTLRVHPVLGADGQLLPTDTTGRHLDQHDQPIPIDSYGRPLDKDGNLLPTNDQGYYVHKPVVKPTDASGEPLVVVGPGGHVLPTDSAGNYVDKDGEPLPTNANNEFIGPDGSPLPVDEGGRVVFDEGKSATLPTDSTTGVQVVGPDGSPLSTDSTGTFVAPDGKPLPVDSEGRPIGADGSPLPKNEEGQYVFSDTHLLTTVTPKPAKPTNQHGQPAVVVDHDGNPLPTDADGNFLMEDGKPVPTNADNVYIGPDGSVLPFDPEGRVVLPSDRDETPKPIPTDDTGRVVQPIVNADGQLWPTDSTGRHIDHKGEQIPVDDYGRPLDKNGDVLPKDDEGRYLFQPIIVPTDDTGRPIQVVGPDGEPLKKNDDGLFVDESGQPLPTNKAKEYVGPDGSPLPTTSDGAVVFGADQAPEAKALPTDDTGKVIYPVVKPDGSPYPTDETNRFVDEHGEPIPIDDFGRPVDEQGQLLPTDSTGNYIRPEAKTAATHPAIGPDGQPIGTELPTETSFVKPTDEAGRPRVVVDADGTPLPVDSEGHFVGPDGQPIPTNANNEYVGPDGSPLPTDQAGNVIHGKETGPGKTLPTDDYGKTIFPVVSPNGEPLPTDSTGHFVDDSGNPIPVNEFGKPLDSAGDVLPQDSNGNYVFKEEEPKPTLPDGNVVPVLKPDGQPAATDSTGRVMGPDGKPLDIKDGHYVDKDGRPLPTDASSNVVIAPTDDRGLPVYPVVDAQGQPLPTDSSGRHLGPDGQPVPVNDEGKPVDADGNLLPRDDEGHFVQSEHAPALSTPAYTILGPDHQPLSTDSSGHFVKSDGSPVNVDSAGRPVSPDGVVLPKDAEGNYVMVSPDGQPTATELPQKPTDSSGKPIVVVNADGVPVPTNADGYFVDSQGSPLPTNADRQYVGPDSSPLPTDQYGNVILAAEDEISEKPLPTDESGKVVYPVVDEDGNLLPTDSTGRHVNSKNEPIPTNDFGKPVDHDGNLLKQNDKGEFIFKEDIKPTDSDGKPILVVGPDGKQLPTDSAGHFVGPDGSPVPTNEAHEYVGPDGSPLPTSADGAVVFGTEQGVPGKTLPTDETGREVHPVVDEDGHLLPTDSTGRHVNKDGIAVPVDDFGRPVDADGQVLPTNADGAYVLSEKRPTPTTSDGKPAVVVGSDGLPLSTNEQGQFVGPDGTPVPVSKDGQFVDKDGQPLPTTKTGQAILSPDKEPSEVVLPTDSANQVVYPIVDKDGKLLPTDSEGHHIDNNNVPVPLDQFGRPLGSDGNPLPKNEEGQYVHPGSKPLKPTDSYGKPLTVVGKDGLPLSTDSQGRFVGPDGTPVPVNKDNQYVNAKDEPLPTNEYGQAIFDDKTAERVLPTDINGQVIYPIVSADGLPLPTDYTGHHTDDRGEIIPLDDYGRPLSPDGNVLPQNEQGQYVHGEDHIATGKPTDQTGKPAVVVNGQGEVLPTDSAGNYLGEDGAPVPTNSHGEYVGPDGSPLPFDPEGRVVFGAGVEPSEGRTLPTDETGRVVQPIVRPDGSLLPTDSTGRHVDGTGEQVPLDDFGKPINRNSGQVLPTDGHGNYIFHDGKPTDSTGNLVQVVDKKGVPLGTDSTGNYILEDGKVVPTNDQFQYLGPDGSPLPLDEQSRAVHPSGGDEDQQTTLPTDDTGKFIYPVVKPDGSPVPRDSSGRYLDDRGEPIPIDDFGRPLDKNGKLLPRKDEKTYVYAGENVLPTDPSGRLVKLVDPDGEPLPTDSAGHAIGPDGSIVPIDSEGRYVGPDGTPLPVDDQGKAVFSPDKGPAGKTLPPGPKIPLPVVDENGSPRPTDSSGYYLDLNGIPLDVDEFGRPHYPDGTLLKQDDSGNFVYEDKRKQEREHCFVQSFVELLLVIDTSENVKILDYRLMKEAIKSFLKEHFDLRENRVRLGLIKYGSQVDVPIALGDYSSAGELLSKIGDARRLKGSAQLGEALRDAVSEFSISATPSSDKVVIVFKGGKAADDVDLPAQALRDESKANVYVVSVGAEDEDDNVIVGGDSSRVLHFKDWKSVEPAALGALTDLICQAVPQDSASTAVWPTRHTKPPQPTGEPRECSTVEYEVDLIVLLDSSKFSQDEFQKTLEGIGTLVDESFDLAPDVVRVGFIVYSDKVSVPVALGHYEDKIELLEKIEDSELMDGTAIASKGLDAARQQLKLHGRNGVAKVVLLITNGNYRGNGQQFAQELRDTHDIQLFVLGINPTQARLPSLQRLVGVEYAKERLLTIDNVEDISNKLNFIRTSLCGRITQTTIEGEDYYTTDRHSTTKRDVTKIPIGITKPYGPTQEPPCKEEAKMSVNIVVDSAGGKSNPEELHDVNLVVQSFLEDYYANKENQKDRPAINLLNIDSNSRSVLNQRTNVPVDSLYNEMSGLFDRAEQENLAIRDKLPDC